MDRQMKTNQVIRKNNLIWFSKEAFIMKRVILTILAAALLISSMPVTMAGAEESAAQLQLIECEQQDFSTACMEGLSWPWDESMGIKIYTEQEGCNPYMLIYRNGGTDFNPKQYLDETYTPHLQEKYGDRLLEVGEYTVYTVEGVQMPGIKYRYQTDAGSEGILFRLFDLRWGGNVCYTLRYYPDSPDATMESLALAVKYFQDGAHYYSQGENHQSAGDELSINGESGYTIEPAQPIVSETYTYQDGRVSMEVPKGWEVLTTGFFADTLCIRAWDPDCPERCVFRCARLDPFLRSESARNWYMDLSRGNQTYQNLSDAPVLEELTLPCFLQHAGEVREYARKYSDQANVLDWRVFPGINDLTVTGTIPSPMPCLDICEDNSIAGITFTDENGTACEGLVTAQPCRRDSMVVSGIDIGHDTVLFYMGFYAPVGELRELEPVLNRCLSSIELTEEFIEQSIEKTGDVGGIMRQMNEITMSAHSGYDSLWESRTDTYDILSQEYSDAILGYDRLYDSETGEVYRAELGFWDDYDLHRGEYNNPNLQKIDDSSRDYYLQTVDYTISR